MSAAAGSSRVGDEQDVTVSSSNDLVKAVDQLLNNLGPKFSKVSAELFAKMDEMSTRLDEMEAAIKAGNDPSTEGSS